MFQNLYSNVGSFQLSPVTAQRIYLCIGSPLNFFDTFSVVEFRTFYFKRFISVQFILCTIISNIGILALKLLGIKSCRIFFHNCITKKIVLFLYLCALVWVPFVCLLLVYGLEFFKLMWSFFFFHTCSNPLQYLSWILFPVCSFFKFFIKGVHGVEYCGFFFFFFDFLVALRWNLSSFERSNTNSVFYSLAFTVI